MKDNEGVRPDGSVSWVCEQCQNDRHPEVSTDYTCCLCLTEETLVDLVEPPKVSHKKKTDREREKERMEKELADTMRIEYRNRQIALNHPMLPREPLKKTTGNNWVHVYCAVWTPEIRFSSAQKMEVAEGFQSISPARYEAVCKLCKNKDHSNKLQEDAGACVSCFQCHANFHASCAFEAGYQFGFDVTPVKGSRKDQITTIKMGEETGSVTAAIWCKEHTVKSIVHPMSEVVDESGTTALQVFVENYKQADLTLTGTVRKATQAQAMKDKAQQALLGASGSGRRESTANSIAAAVRRGARTSLAAAEAKNAEAKAAAEAKGEAEETAAPAVEAPATETERRCLKCKVDVTPRWHTVVRSPPPTPPKSPIQRRMSMTLGEYADLQRERSADASRNGTSGEPSAPPPEHVDGHPTPRFISTLNIGPRASEQPQAEAAPVPSQEDPAPQTNGDAQPPADQSAADEVFHNHALPRYQNPAIAHTPPNDPPEEEPAAAAIQEYLCHKCFIRRKLEPTPPPAAKPEPVVLSPPRQFPLQLDWSRPPGAQPLQSSSGPIRMPWDDPPRPPQPPPQAPTPQVNGQLNGQMNGHMNGPMNGVSPAPQPPPQNYGPPPQPPTPNYGPPPQPQTPGYSLYGNGYHQPPPPQHHGPPHGPPMHERQHSYGYGPPPQQNYTPQPPQQSYAPPPPRPSPMQSYPPQNLQMPNGVHSPHVSQPPLQSPTLYGPPPGPYQYGHGVPRRTESPFSSQLPPIGQPLHSSPQGSFANPRPDMMNGQQPPQHQQPAPQQQQQSQQPIPQQQQQPSNGLGQQQMPPGQIQQPPMPSTHMPQQAQPPQSLASQQQAGQQTSHGRSQEVRDGQIAQPPLPTSYSTSSQNDGSIAQPPLPYGGSQSQPQGQARPSTPQEGQSNGNVDGASASPNLRNLLH